MTTINFLYAVTGFVSGMFISYIYAMYRFWIADKKFQRIIKEKRFNYEQKERIEKNVFQDLCNAHNIQLTVGDKIYYPETDADGLTEKDLDDIKDLPE